MALIVTIVLITYLVLKTRVNTSPTAQVRTVIRVSKYTQYEPYIINQMNLESGYVTNTLSQPPLFNVFSMSTVRRRPTTQIDSYENPNIDGGQSFGVYSGYRSAAEDFIMYLDYIKMPGGLTCKGYNKFVASKGYSITINYEELLNNMCK